MKIKRISIATALLAALIPVAGRAATFQLKNAEGKPWTAILGSVGMTQDAQATPEVIVAGATAPPDLAAAAENKILIIEGTGPLAARAGIVPKTAMVKVRQIADVHAPDMQIFWEKPLELPVVSLPADFHVFASEKWKKAPLLAGKRTAHGAILWLATDPGANSTEHFPYLLQALQDLGWTPAAETTGLWAFFDSSYRIRADPDYLAARWRSAGIAALHIAAWHNMEPDAMQDDYLKRVIEACHRHAILVYAWLELPHVSEKFWADHPAWREKTAVGQDAQLDWRKLMNLQNQECRAAITELTANLLERFDWDGVNLAELYFESLEGASNPARFTPMNEDVRADFRRSAGFDPKELFEPGSSHFAAAHPEALRQFLDYRAALASRMQRDWLAVVDQSRLKKPYLAVTLTHIDDRFEPGIRDALGADVARSLPLIEARKSTLLVEDPAPLWALGPERYRKLAEQYKQLTSDASSLAVDINVVERYQEVYPTKKQTGVELLELVHQAAVSFGRVALYFENSLEKQDLSLLPVAASTARVHVRAPDELATDAAEVTRIPWQGPAELDGKPWPLQDDRFVLVPSGKHHLSTGIRKPTVLIGDFNGSMESARSGRDRVDVSYNSRTRAIVLLASAVSSVELDGQPYQGHAAGKQAMLLPRGQHVVSFIR